MFQSGIIHFNLAVKATIGNTDKGSSPVYITKILTLTMKRKTLIWQIASAMVGKQFAPKYLKTSHRKCFELFWKKKQFKIRIYHIPLIANEEKIGNLFQFQQLHI